jgi:anaerobic magnesium-protoporphyrin IX monomethyl ester cyclase
MFLLINPKTSKSTESQLRYFREPNLGLLYLAAVLEQNGISVDLLDLEQYYHLDEFTLNDLLLKKQFNYKVFGITSLTNNFDFSLSIAKIIKSNDPNCKIIFGGPHVSFLYAELLRAHDTIDFVCVGESEYSFLSLARILQKDNFKDPSLEQKVNKIRGIAYKNSKNEIIYTGQQVIPNIEDIPLPARHKLTQENFDYLVANIIVNRGCPNQCSFCSRQDLFKFPRVRNPNSIISEIKKIRSLQTYEYLNFYDNINVNTQFFTTFLSSLIKNKIEMPWGCELRVDTITREEAHLLKQAGCQLVATGVESASPSVLKKNFKYQDPEKVLRGITYIKDVNIPIQAYFVLGLPGETREEFFKTTDYIKKLPLSSNDKLNYFAATPYPGSQLWNEREAFGISIFQHDFSMYDCEHLIFDTKILPREDLEELFNIAKNLEKVYSNK